jgi:N-acetylglucosamine-6-sulfatase
MPKLCLRRRVATPVLRRRRPLVIGLTLLAAAAIFAACAAKPRAARARHAPPARTTAAATGRPNIVFVLTDDLSLDLLPYMPRVQQLQREGLTFSDYFVTDSLCCPSRSSIFTGNFPHDTRVFSNVGTMGGFRVFHNRGEESQTFAVALQGAGYRTAMMGKYLNGYLGVGAPANVPPTYVPPGWSEWDVAGDGYPEFDYTLNENGALHAYGHAPSDYLTDVLARKGVDFIDRSAAAGQPFFLELSTFAPHSPYVPAPRHADDFPQLRAPRPPSFDRLPTHPPGWLAVHRPLTSAQMAWIDTVFRRRAQAVQAVDDMLARVEATLAARGLDHNTYIVFSSDNGFHTGQYRLTPGKLTAFDTDVHVPLIVAGPGVPAGATTGRMAENIDLAPTFAALGGTRLPCDGHSLVPLLRGAPTPNWRNTVLIEHHGADLRGVDPDFQQPPSGNPRTYEAMRTHRFLYVEYRGGEREYYDLVRDPFELHNVARRLTLLRSSALHAQLGALERCHTGAACWAAAHVPPAPPGLGLRARRVRR